MYLWGAEVQNDSTAIGSRDLSLWVAGFVTLQLVPFRQARIAAHPAHGSTGRWEPDCRAGSHFPLPSLCASRYSSQHKSSWVSAQSPPCVLSCPCLLPASARLSPPPALAAGPSPPVLSLPSHLRSLPERAAPVSHCACRAATQLLIQRTRLSALRPWGAEEGSRSQVMCTARGSSFFHRHALHCPASGSPPPPHPTPRSSHLCSSSPLFPCRQNVVSRPKPIHKLGILYSRIKITLCKTRTVLRAARCPPLPPPPAHSGRSIREQRPPKEQRSSDS